MELRTAQRGGAVGGVERDAGVAVTDRLGDLAEAIELLAEERVVVLVGGGEVGPHARQLDPLVDVSRVGEPDHGERLARAEAAHAGVVLDVHPGPEAEHPGALGELLEELRAPDRELRSRLQGDVELRAGEGAHDEDRDLLADPLAQLERLRRRRDREPGRAAAKSGVGALEHAVAVSVRLDDRTELGPLGEAGRDGRAVALDRPEIDHRGGPLERIVAAQPRSPSGSASITSVAITDSAPWTIGRPRARPGHARGRPRMRPRTDPCRGRRERRSFRRGRRRSRRWPAPGCPAR